MNHNRTRRFYICAFNSHTEIFYWDEFLLGLVVVSFCKFWSKFAKIVTSEPLICQSWQKSPHGKIK